MTKIITVASQKGGVGKTTTVLNLGYSMSRLGQRVLLVDGDPQGGMAIASNLKRRTTLGLINLLKNNSTPEDVIIPTRDETLAIVGSGASGPEDTLIFETEARKGNLGKAIRSIAESYDYVFVDSPAGTGSIVTMLLAASHSVVMPVNCRTIALKTLPSFLKLTKKIRQSLNSDLRIEGIVFTMLNNRNPSELKVYEEVRKQFPESVIFKTTIPLDEHFETASANAVPVGMLPGGEEAARSFMDLAMEMKVRELQDRARGISDENVDGLF